MAHKKQRILFITLCIILTAGLIILFYILTAGTTKSGKIIVDEFEIQLKDIDVLNTEDSTYPNSIKQAITEIEDNSRIIEISIDVSNTKNKDKRFKVYEFQLENGGWSNGIDPDLYSESNKDPGLEPIIEGNGNKKLILTYTAYPSQMSEEEWKKFEDNMELQLDATPEVKVLRIL